MAYYVMLNFEDADPNAKEMGAPNRYTIANVKNSGISGPAGNTLKVYQNRAQVRHSHIGDKSAVYYPCLELIERDKKKTLQRSDVENIRTDCLQATTIAVVLHGKVADTEHGFSTGTEYSWTWQDLGRFMLLLLPDSREYNIALIMCYAARCNEAGLDHDGMIPKQELRTSFAYKFFRSMCQSRRVRMTARTGAVGSDEQLSHTVELEHEVLRKVERGRASDLRDLYKSSMEREKAGVLKRNDKTENDFKNLLWQFALNPQRPVNGELERFAKEYLPYSDFWGTYVKNTIPERTGHSSKYGKLIYTYKGGTLKIIARYQTEYHAPNYCLYKGGLL